MQDMDIPQARTDSGLFSYSLLQSGYQALLDLVFPPRCVHCGKVDYHFCDSCQNDLLESSILSLVDNTIVGVKEIASTGYHQGVLQSAVQGLKYHGQRELAPILAQRMATLLESLDWTYDIVIPVPMHTQRLRERGYNQAKEISLNLAQILGKMHSDTAIIRERATRSQVGLNAIERRENLRDAFSADEGIIKGKSLLLVDDVKTTGATMVGCATAAITVGATQVYGITVTVAS